MLQALTRTLQFPPEMLPQLQITALPLSQTLLHWISFGQEQKPGRGQGFPGDLCPQFPVNPSIPSVTSNLSSPNTWQQLFTTCPCRKCLPKTSAYEGILSNILCKPGAGVGVCFLFSPLFSRPEFVFLETYWGKEIKYPKR